MGFPGVKLHPTLAITHLVGTTTGSKDQEDLHQQTPLHLASQQGHLEVRFLQIEGQQGHQLPGRKSHHRNLTANRPLKNDGWKTIGTVCFQGPAVKLQVGIALYTSSWEKKTSQPGQSS